jgi:hypothetical protein
MTGNRNHYPHMRGSWLGRSQYGGLGLGLCNVPWKVSAGVRVSRSGRYRNGVVVPTVCHRPW